MKTCKTNIESRRQKIIDKLKKEHTIKVDELASQLRVSELTIRRDLQILEDKNILTRFYGGAKYNENSSERSNENNINESYKHAIAKYAASQVDDGDTLFINTSSTALLMLKYIKNKHVTVITNNAQAVFINYDPKVTVVLTGGEIRTPKNSMTGDFSINNLNRVIANKAFLGCSGFDAENGMTTEILPEVSVNTTMVQRCKGNLYLLADSSKLGITQQFMVTNASTFHHLITDKRANEQQLNEFRNLNIDVITLDLLFSYQQNLSNKY